ncbi:MAG: hypothetical protein ACMUIP_06665 [bacterium]
MNMFMVFLNFGLSYKHWNAREHNWDIKKDEGNVYIGGGLFNYLQYQVGYSTSENILLRLRSDISIDEFFTIDIDFPRSRFEKTNVRKAFIISPIIEAQFGEKDDRIVFGVGFGSLYSHHRT